MMKQAQLDETLQKTRRIMMMTRIARGVLLLIGVMVVSICTAWGFMAAIDEHVRIQQEVWRG